jgi:hypothetical protein
MSPKAKYIQKKRGLPVGANIHIRSEVCQKYVPKKRGLPKIYTKEARSAKIYTKEARSAMGVVGKPAVMPHVIFKTFVLSLKDD